MLPRGSKKKPSVLPLALLFPIIVEKQPMSLRGKFIWAVVLILTLSYGVLILYTSHLQNRLVLGQAEQQARMLYRQVLLTRQWVADHQGLFLLQSATAPANSYLAEPVLTTAGGEVLVKRNPAADAGLETKRLELAIAGNVLTDYVKEHGMGNVDAARFAKSIEQLGTTYEFKTTPEAKTFFDPEYLPTDGSLMLQ